MSRLASCQAVLSALETHGPRMVEILGGPSGPVLEEVGSTPFEPLLVTLGGRSGEPSRSDDRDRPRQSGSEGHDLEVPPEAQHSVR